MPKEINFLSGWLVIDKPAGLTSAQVVGRLKRLYHPAKIGHTGTLDPLATGVLPIAFGKATKLIPYVMDGEKAYNFTIRFGVQTTTDDLEGEVISQNTYIPTAKEIRAILPKFLGKIRQVPPVYSALKVGGKRAYALARNGEKVELASREIQIYELKLLKKAGYEATFSVRCSKGTYVRSLGRDLALALGSCGTISKLCRTSCGCFTKKEEISLDFIEKLEYNAKVLLLKPIATVLDDILVLAVSEEEARRLCQGQALRVKRGLLPEQEGTVLVTWQDQSVVLAFWDGYILKPKRMLTEQIERIEDVVK